MLVVDLLPSVGCQHRPELVGIEIVTERVQSAIAACDAFITQLRRFKLRYTADDEERKTLRDALRQVKDYCDSLEQALVGSDDPEVPHT